MNPDGDENQNNLNSVPNADPTQQGIFTPEAAPRPTINQPQDQQAITGTVVEPTPRPTVDEPQDQPTITGTVVEPAQTGLSHPYLSNHPTQSFASGVGDIVIGKERKKPKNKTFLLFIIGGVVLLFILILILILALSQKSGAKNPTEFFNLYANYMLYGEDSTANFTESYQYGSQYYISHLSSDSEKKEFLSSAQEKFQKFYDEYNKNVKPNQPENEAESEESDAVADELLAILDVYKNDLSMAYYEQSSPILSANEVMMYFIEDSGTAESRIREYYDAHNNASDEVLAHAEQNLQDASALISAYRSLSQNGCIAESGRIDNSCLMSSGDNANQVIENYNTMFSIVSAENYARSIRLYQNIWVIQEKLNEEN